MTQAQQISVTGEVHNLEQKPMLYATVTLLTIDSALIQQGSTDDKGRFLIKTTKGEFRLILSQFGRELFSEQVKLTTDLNLGVIQVNDSFNLEGVTVYASPTLMQVIGDKLYFNIENSPLAKGNNGMEVLRKSPKVSLGSDGRLLLKNKNVSILINGRKINLGDKDLEDYLSSINSEDIKRLEIQDLASSEQDASSDGGTVNIILKKAPNGFRGIAKAYYQYKNENYDRYGGSVNLNLGKENWNAYSTISYSENEDFGVTKSDFNYFDGRKNYANSSFSQTYKSLGARLGAIYYPNSRNEVGIEGYFNRNDMNILNSGMLDVHNRADITLSSISKSLSKTNTDIGYITFNYSLAIDTLGSSLKLVADFGKNSTDPFNDVLIRYPTDSTLDNHYKFDSRALSHYYTAQADWSQKFNYAWQFDGGAKVSWINRDNNLDVHFLQDLEWKNDGDQQQNFENRESTFAAYFTMSKRLQKHFFKMGLRVENTYIEGINKVDENKLKQEYTNFFPTVFYQYNISDSRNINLSYKRSISRPAFTDLNPSVLKINDYLYHIGNPNLRPLFIDRIDLAYSFHKQSISMYGIEIDEIIQKVYFQDENNINYFQAQNYGTYRSMGIDHSYNDNLFKWLYMSLSSGAFYNTFSNRSGKKFDGASFYNNSYLQVKPFKTYSLELSSNYQHGFRQLNIKSRHLYQLDISISKPFLKESLLVKLSALDVLNTKFDENTSFFTDFNFKFYQKRLTRGVFMQIQYALDNKRKAKRGSVKSENESRARL